MKDKESENWRFYGRIEKALRVKLLMELFDFLCIYS